MKNSFVMRIIFSIWTFLTFFIHTTVHAQFVMSPTNQLIEATRNGDIIQV